MRCIQGQVCRLDESREEVRAQHTRRPELRSTSMICVLSRCLSCLGRQAPRAEEMKFGVGRAGAQTNRAVAKRLLGFGWRPHDSTPDSSVRRKIDFDQAAMLFGVIPMIHFFFSLRPFPLVSQPSLDHSPFVYIPAATSTRLLLGRVLSQQLPRRARQGWPTVHPAQIASCMTRLSASYQRNTRILHDGDDEWLVGLRHAAA